MRDVFLGYTCDLAGISSTRLGQEIPWQDSSSCTAPSREHGFGGHSANDCRAWAIRLRPSICRDWARIARRLKKSHWTLVLHVCAKCWRLVPNRPSSLATAWAESLLASGLRALPSKLWRSCL